MTAHDDTPGSERVVLNRLYHVTPLHYLPSILSAGALYPKSVLAAVGIEPRRSAVRRDRMLGLADYVHLSPAASTPLLSDKTANGYPHVVLAFAASSVLALREVAVLPYNTKAWKSRAAEAPVVQRADIDRLIRQYLEMGRRPSLEILVKYGLPLDRLEWVAFRTEHERDAAAQLTRRLGLPMPATCVHPDIFGVPGSEMAQRLQLVEQYFAECMSNGRLIPPPEIDFD